MDKYITLKLVFHTCACAIVYDRKSAQKELLYENYEIIFTEIKNIINRNYFYGCATLFLIKSKIINFTNIKYL